MRKLAFGLAQLTVLLTLGACGAASGSPSATTSSSPSASVAANSPAAKPVLSSPAAAVKPSASTGAQDEAPELTKARLFYPTLSGTIAYAKIASEKGLFRKYGVDVSAEYAQANSAIASLVSGEAQIAVTDGVLFLSGVAAGSPLKLVANVDRTIPYGIYGGADITKASDLKGKTLAVGMVGDATYLAARLALLPVGINLGTDIQLLPGGNSPGRFAALTSGQVAGAVLDEDAFGKQAEAKGMHHLVSLRDQKPPWIGGGVVTTSSFAKANPKTLTAMLKGLIEGTVYFQDEKNKTESLAIMAKDLKSDPNDPLVADAYESYHKRSTAPPAPQLADVNATLDGLRAVDSAHYGPVKGEDVIDGSFVAALDSSGFLKSIGR